MTIVLNGTTGITNVNGTAAAPAATGTDTDTGIFYGTNTVSLATNGTTALTVDASQNTTLAGTLTLGTATQSVPSGSAPLYASRAWVNFNGTGTVAIRASANVSSITDSGVGLYDVNFTTSMTDANYAPVVTAYSSSSALYAIGGQTNGQAPTTAKFRIALGAGASLCTDTTAGYADLPYIFASVFR